MRFCQATGDYSAITATYDLEFPFEAPVGTSLRRQVSQEVPPNSTDRFQVTVGTSSEANAEGTTVVLSQLYVVRVKLWHDGAPQPIDAGLALVVDPLLYPFYFDPKQFEVGKCARENARTILALAKSGVAYSPQVGRIKQKAQALLAADPAPEPG